MRKKSLVVVVFLLMLYISPMIFISSSVGVAIPTEPNMNKDFVLSAEDWLDGWDYRKEVSLDGSSGAGINYTVPITVPYGAKMQADFDDIRFTDDDGITLLDHWRESYTVSTTALFWVKITDNLDSNQLIYIYYGNDTSSSASNGNATFLFYEDWSSQSLDAWVIPPDQIDGQTTYSPTDATQGGYVAKVEADAADSYMLLSDFNYTASFATRFRSNIEEATAGNTGRMGSGWVGAYGWAIIQTSGTLDESFWVYDDDANQDSQTMTNAYFDTWVIFEIQRGFQIVGNNFTKLVADDVDIEVGSFQPDINSNPICSIQVVDSEEDIYSDWVVCRKFITSEPSFISFGAEEEYKEWEGAGTAIILFEVPVFTGSLDAMLIFLGLILIPASTLYFVKGGKDEMSSDKVFYCLLAFVIGWALFLGGIYG